MPVDVILKYTLRILSESRASPINCIRAGRTRRMRQPATVC